MFGGDKHNWILYISHTIHLEDRVNGVFHGLNVGFDSKVFDLKNWKHGSGID